MQSNETVIYRDKYQVLATRTPVVLLLICGFLSIGIILFGAYFFYSEFMSAGNVLDSFRFDSTALLLGLILSAVVGAGAALIRRYEYISLGLAYRKGEVFKLHFYLLYIFIFLLLVYPAFFLVMPRWMAGGGRSFSAVLPVLLLLTLVTSWVIRNLWDLIFRFLLRLFSPVDWGLYLDREHFQRMMRLKFAEVMRYQGPLSLIMIGMQNFEVLKGRYSRRKILKLQEKAVEFISQAVRNLDIVGRIGEGQFIATLVHTAGMDARVPGERISEKMEELVKEQAVDIRFSLGIASYDQTMSNEEELIRKAQAALHRAISEKESIVYL